MSTSKPVSKKTRQRVLESACVILAEKGFRDTTVVEICDSAGANSASVNYYFGSKQNLYLAVWKHMSNSVHTQYVERVKSIADPAKRLREVIAQRVRHVFDDEQAGHFRKLIHGEMGDPTEVHDKIIKRFMLPLIELFTATIAEILGRPESDPIVRRCAFSLQSQLVSLSRLRMKVDPMPLLRLMGTTTPTPAQVEELTEHLVRFVMAGIRAVGRKG